VVSVTGVAITGESSNLAAGQTAQLAASADLSDVQLPGDQHPEISLPPTAREVRLDVQGHNVCEEHRRFFPYGRLMAEFPVHHDGVLKELCGYEATCGLAFDIGVQTFFYRVEPNGPPSRIVPVWDGTRLVYPAQGGYTYYYVKYGDIENCHTNYKHSMTHPR
jgi:hypothetical protein